MTDAGFFKGTSADQDSRFSDKNKKLMKTMKFAENIDKKIDMKKIRLELMRPYITNILSTLTTVEDEVMVEYVFSQLEEKQHPDGKLIQIMMTGFLGKTKARTFMGELWNTLCEAQVSPHGIPNELIELKREELLKKKSEESKIAASLNKNKEDIERSLNMNQRGRDTGFHQTSIQRPRSPAKIKEPTEKRTRSNDRSQRHRRSRTRSRSPRHNRDDRDLRRSSRSPRHKSGSSRYTESKDERKSSRRFKEKTPDIEKPAPQELESNNAKLKKLDLTAADKEKKPSSELVMAVTEKEPEQKMEVDKPSDKEDSSSSDSSSGSDSDDSSSSSSSGSGSSSSSSGSESDDSDGADSSSNSSKKLKKRKSSKPSSPQKEKASKVKEGADVHTNGNSTKVSNGGDAVKETAPLHRILQAEKKKESDRSHRGSRDDEDSRRRRHDEDRRRYEDDRRRREEENRKHYEEERRRRREEEARRYEEDRRRRDEERRRRDEERRLRYEEDRKREERRAEERRRDKEESRSRRRDRHDSSERENGKHERSNRSDSESDHSYKKSSSHKKKKTSRDDRKKSKKSKKSRSRERDDGRSNKDTIDIEKSLRAKALESLASKQRARGDEN